MSLNSHGFSNKPRRGSFQAHNQIREVAHKEKHVTFDRSHMQIRSHLRHIQTDDDGKLKPGQTHLHPAILFKDVSNHQKLCEHTKKKVFEL